MSTPQVLQLFPDTLIDRLIQVGDTERPRRFEIGDIRNTMVALVVEMRPLIKLDDSEMTRTATVVDVDMAIVMLLKHEWSIRSVQRFALVAASIPLPVREKYDQLPFSHFDLAREFGDDNIITVLDLAMEQFERWGRPPSCDVLRALADFALNKLTSSTEDDSDTDESPTMQNGVMRVARVLRSFLDHQITEVPAHQRQRIKRLTTQLLDELDSVLEPVL